MTAPSGRMLTEVHEFSKAELETLAKQSAKMFIVGSLYTGTFHDQTVEWQPDGSLRVITRHTPVAFEDALKNARQMHKPTPSDESL